MFAESSQPAGTVTDFVDFWAASRLLLNGGNPFSPREVLELQRTVGYRDSKPLLMWNPPWTLSFILPFGALPYLPSQLLWLIMHVLFILISVQKLWAIYSQKKQKSYLPLVVTLTFFPCWFVVLLGQISPLVLLGIVGFLHFEKKRNDFIAGLTISLISVKPHLIYLFWIGILFWILHQRRWMIAVGAIAAGSIVATLPAIIDPAVYAQFIEMYRNPGRTTPFDLPAPSLGSLLTLLVPHSNFPIQFLPPFLSICWLGRYWAHHKGCWDWAEQMPILVLVSLTMSAYAWTYDYVVLLPAVVQGLVYAIHGPPGRAWYRNWAVVLYGIINGLHLSLRFVLFSDYYFFWYAPALLVTYLGVRATPAKLIQPGSPSFSN